ncbi:MAG: DMT family transporter [Phycisphaerales bacterium]|jgi:drug/metabolite transporter (DMT)-like permease|nr:DMT family transporter [Phycisphaeraceae bacterium]
MPSGHGTKASGLGGGVSLAVFTLLSWSSVPLFLHWFAGPQFGLEAFSQNGWRYGISAVFWLPFLAWAFFGPGRGGGAGGASDTAGLLRAAIIPAAFNIAGQTAFAWGPTLLDPGFFSFIFRVQIIFVTLGAYLLFASERDTLRRPRYWLGTALVIGGSIVMIALKQPVVGGVEVGAGGAEAGGAGGAEVVAAAASHAPSLLGVLVALAGAVLFAGYGLSVRACVGQYRPILAFGVICQYTAVGVIVLMFIFGWTWHVPATQFSLFQMSMLVLSAFIGIALSHVSYYASLTSLGVAVTVGIIQLQPIVTAVASVLLLGERLSPGQWAAGVVGIIGAILMISASRAPMSAAAVEE